MILAFNLGEADLVVGSGDVLSLWMRLRAGRAIRGYPSFCKPAAFVPALLCKRTSGKMNRGRPPEFVGYSTRIDWQSPSGTRLSWRFGWRAARFA
jgi:hypothetical protein